MSDVDHEKATKYAKEQIEMYRPNLEGTCNLASAYLDLGARVEELEDHKQELMFENATLTERLDDDEAALQREVAELREALRDYDEKRGCWMCVFCSALKEKGEQDHIEGACAHLKAQSLLERGGESNE